MTPPVDAPPRLPPAFGTTRFAGLVVLLSAVWWAITEGALSAWYVGVPAIGVAAFVLARTGPLNWRPFSPLAAVRFAVFFVWESLVGGIDVAARVLGPELRIRPGVQLYRWRLPVGGLRILAMATVCLQPGTLAVRDNDETVEIHVLDRSMDLAGSMARLESRIAAMAGVDLRSARDER